MEFSEVDRALEELESRIERLKALYEQYFMGTEKLEPLVPRKDVDRRITILRRESIRNTAQRFKFQTVVQRYNSFQQYWTRVQREIEQGTYHRDVARAAARFGAKETLTILGKKQAEKYQRLVENQDARRKRRITTHVVDDEATLADDELLFVDDEAAASDDQEPDSESRPTPVILSGRASVPPPPPLPRASSPGMTAVPPPPRASTPGMQSVPPPLPFAARQSGQMPGPVLSIKPPRVPEFSMIDDQDVESAPGDKPTEPARRTMIPIRPETMFPIMMRRPSDTFVKVPEATAPEPAHQRSPSIPPDPEAGKRRVAELAAQVKQRSSATMPRPSRPLDLELDLGGGKSPPAKAERPLEIDFDRTAKVKEQASPRAERALDLDFDQALSPAKPSRTVEPSPPVEAPRRAEREGLTGRTERQEERVVAPVAEARPPVEVMLPREPSVAEERRDAASAARDRATAAREASRAEAKLSDTRIRQIYGEYVDAKRAAKESTAGVTFDTLAKQLRQQAEKLEASHPGRSVDYNVVMKNGKPTLKPVLR